MSPFQVFPFVFVFLWSTGFIAAKYAAPYAPPIGFLSLRFFLSIMCLVIIVVYLRVSFYIRKDQVLKLFFSGILMQGGYLGGVWFAVKEGMSSGLSALIIGLQPILTAFIIAYLGHSVSVRQWLGLVLGFLGLACVVSEKIDTIELTTIRVDYYKHQRHCHSIGFDNAGLHLSKAVHPAQ